MPEKFDYLTKQTAYPIIARYFESGLRPYAFYKKEGLTKSQFYLWRKQYMKEHNLCADTGSRKVTGKDAAPVFHPMEVSEPTGKQSSVSDRIELEYPNGVVLRVDGTLDEIRLVSLIKLY